MRNTGIPKLDNFYPNFVPDENGNRILIDAEAVGFYPDETSKEQNVQAVLRSLLAGAAGGGLKLYFFKEGENPATYTATKAGTIYMYAVKNEGTVSYYEQYICEKDGSSLIYVGKTSPELPTDILREGNVGAGSDLQLDPQTKLLKLRDDVVKTGRVVIVDTGEGLTRDIRVRSWIGGEEDYGKGGTNSMESDNLMAPVNEVLKALNDIMDGTLTE